MSSLFSNGKFSTKNIVQLVVLIAVLILPFLIKSNYLTTVIITCFTFGSLGVAWNLIGGYGAQISWCHAAFVATGAYTSFILNKNFGISPFVCIPLAMLLALGISTIIGYGTLRLRGPFFSISTIAFAEILRVLLLYFKGITGGASGLFVTYREDSFWNLTFSNDKPFYYIMLFVLVTVILITAAFEKSKTGYYLGAIKGDEDAAISLGIPAFKIKLRAFQLSAVIAAAVGTIYAFFLTYIDPASICGMDLSVKIGVVAIVGGIGTLWGPVVGAFVIIPLIEFASHLMGQQGGTNLLYGLALMTVVIFRSDGLLSIYTEFREKQNKKVALKNSK
ncbi:MAG: branched-chain amino acid ABC transporter permease [Lacrimispora sp.]|uniref:branched-chain amino acid ABC transporter permease n=1 Tax=Lacrimispora sp. TaxID=2719234 RepID=UPI0039E540BF